VKVYTKTGDGGETSLLSGARVAKHHSRVEAYGTVDELNTVLGLLATEPLDGRIRTELLTLQRSLFDVGAALADVKGNTKGSWRCDDLEAWIDEMERELLPLRQFVLPGGSRAAALAHLARAVCRRAERRVSLLVSEDGSVAEGIIPFLNRLSDVLFVLARLLNARLGVRDVPWHPAANDPPGG